jgi:polysaccharide pyruvyl transferase WcaK-like protein
MFLLAKYKLINLGAIGVSIGPFTTDEEHRYISKVLKDFKFLILRDKSSYDIAIKMNLPYKPVLAADLAFLLPETIKDLDLKMDKKKPQKLLGVSLCHYERYSSKNLENEERRESEILKVLNELKKNLEIKFRFFIMNGNSDTGDKEVTNNIVERLELEPDRFEIKKYNTDTLQTVADIHDCNVMFTVRLHGAIFAASQNIPSLLIEYHKKCSDYLTDIGVAEEWRIGDMQSPLSRIVTIINTLLEQKPSNFYTRRDELLIAAKNNFLDGDVLKKINENE